MPQRETLLIPVSVRCTLRVEELVEEHSKDLTTEDLEELKKQLNQERDKEDKSAYQRRRTTIKREECQQVTLKKCCTTGKSLSLATKWHPNKAEMNRLCALVEDKCLNHFKNILKKKENFNQLWTDFLLLL